MMLTDYGFRWGPMAVTRLFSSRLGKRENHVLGITTEHHDVQVSVSKTGRSVRVWLDGRELH